MREMKDSGIEWIGVIPADWDLKRIQHTIDEIKKFSSSNRAGFIFSQR